MKNIKLPYFNDDQILQIKKNLNEALKKKLLGQIITNLEETKAVVFECAVEAIEKMIIENDD